MHSRLQAEKKDNGRRRHRLDSSIQTDPTLLLSCSLASSHHVTTPDFKGTVAETPIGKY